MNRKPPLPDGRKIYDDEGNLIEDVESEPMGGEPEPVKKSLTQSAFNILSTAGLITLGVNAYPAKVPTMPEHTHTAMSELLRKVNSVKTHEHPASEPRGSLVTHDHKKLRATVRVLAKNALRAKRERVTMHKKLRHTARIALRNKKFLTVVEGTPDHWVQYDIVGPPGL